MQEASPISQSATNLIGHALGTILFAVFLWLAIRRTASFRGRAALPIVAAALAFLWDLTSILALTVGSGEAALAALGFTCLSLLPAVLLHVCASETAKSAVRLGYGISFAATCCHVAELVTGDGDLHRLGLSIITVGFSALTVLIVALGFRTRQPYGRLMGAMSLLLFSASFVHLSDGHLDEAWSAALFVHHASIPLALFILLQDYRFVFADAFIQVVANVLLAVGFGWAITRVGDGQGFLAKLASASLIVGLFGIARAAVQTGLFRLLFARPPRDRIEAAMHAIRSTPCGEADLFTMAGTQMAALMGASVLPEPAAGSVSIEIETHPIHLGGRSNGRPYLSFDLEVLQELADAASERIRQIRQSEGDRLLAQAELRALQSQIHPHFLMNCLNAVYGAIPRTAVTGRKAILDLAEMFRYLADTRKEMTPIQAEMRVVTAYLAIESLRLGPRLRSEIQVEEGLDSLLIPPLTIQPLVENAVKHGVAANPDGGLIEVHVRRQGGGVLFQVRDSGRGLGNATSSPSGMRIGLENVSRRLRLQYGEDSLLEFSSSAAGTTVSFTVPDEVRSSAVHLENVASLNR